MPAVGHWTARDAAAHVTGGLELYAGLLAGADSPAATIDAIDELNGLRDVPERDDYARVGVGEFWLVDPEGPSALILRPPAEPATLAEFVLVEDLDATDVLASPLETVALPVRDFA